MESPTSISDSSNGGVPIQEKEKGEEKENNNNNKNKKKTVPPTTFLSLPLKLRHKIYKLTDLIHPTHQLRLCYGKHNHRLSCSLPPTLSSLRQVNHQIRSESTRLFLRKNEFFIHDTGHPLKARPGCICASLMCGLRNFEIWMNDVVRTRVWFSRHAKLWKAEFRKHPELVDEERRRGEQWCFSEEMERTFSEGEGVLEVFRQRVEISDGWSEEAYVAFVVGMDEIEEGVREEVWEEEFEVWP